MMPTVQFNNSGSAESVAKMLDASDVPEAGRALVRAMMADFPQGAGFAVAMSCSGNAAHSTLSVTVMASQPMPLLDKDGNVRTAGG